VRKGTPTIESLFCLFVTVGRRYDGEGSVGRCWIDDAATCAAVSEADMATKDELHVALATAMLNLTADGAAALLRMPKASVGTATSAFTSGMWAIELDRLDLAKRALAVLQTMAAKGEATKDVAREQRAITKAVKELRAAVRPPRKPRRR
jgi:leucyl aminopeptidase (aminopeptidase T)